MVLETQASVVPEVVEEAMVRSLSVVADLQVSEEDGLQCLRGTLAWGSHVAWG